MDGAGGEFVRSAAMLGAQNFRNERHVVIALPKIVFAMLTEELEHLRDDIRVGHDGRDDFLDGGLEAGVFFVREVRACKPSAADAVDLRNSFIGV